MPTLLIESTWIFNDATGGMTGISGNERTVSVPSEVNAVGLVTSY